MKFSKRGIPVCPKCGKQMKRVGGTYLLGMQTGRTYGHKKCNTMLTVVLPSKEKYFTGIMGA